MTTILEMYNEAEKLKDDGRNEEAIDKLVALLEQDEGFALAHLALAVLYGKVGRSEDAVAHGRRACELDPNDPFSFTAMSVTYQRAFQATQDATYIQLAEEAMTRARTLQ